MAVSFSVRVPDMVHTKLRIISAFKNESLNAVVNSALKDTITAWESRYGEVPQPPKEFQGQS